MFMFSYRFSFICYVSNFYCSMVELYNLILQQVNWYILLRVPALKVTRSNFESGMLYRIGFIVDVGTIG